MELTIALAVGAGLLSFLSPCVLPLVPAYVGQLSAVAVAGQAPGQRRGGSLFASLSPLWQGSAAVRS